MLEADYRPFILALVLDLSLIIAFPQIARVTPDLLGVKCAGEWTAGSSGKSEKIVVSRP